MDAYCEQKNTQTMFRNVTYSLPDMGANNPNAQSESDERGEDCLLFSCRHFDYRKKNLFTAELDRYCYCNYQIVKTQ